MFIVFNSLNVTTLFQDSVMVTLMSLVLLGKLTEYLYYLHFRNATFVFITTTVNVLCTKEISAKNIS